MSGPLWILSWDGAAPWLIERAMAADALPNLRALREAGASAAGSTPDHPDVATPPGHATLWTGHRASEHGITSFRIPRQPRGAHDLLAWDNGFDASYLLREPLWVTAAAAGRTSTLVHTPLSGPIEAWERDGIDTEKIRVFHGYGAQQAPPAVVRPANLRPCLDWRGLPFDLAGSREFQYRARPVSVPVVLLRGERGFERVYIGRDKTPGSPGVLVEPGPDAPWSDPLPIGADGATVSFRLFDLDPESGALTLASSEAMDLETLPRDAKADYLRDLGSFRGVGSYRLYGAGEFGEPYTDGAAEARYMETHAQAMAHFVDASVWAIERYPADLMVFYNPGIDEVQHSWAGMIRAGEPCHDPAKAEVVWPWILEAYRRADRHLGELRARLPADGRLVVLSDHGISGIWKHFLPNVVLRDAGLLKAQRGRGGKIDLKRTRALYHPANNMYVFVNGDEHPGGVVPADQRDEVLDAATDALMAAQDPDTGRSVLAHVVRVDRLPEDSELRGQGRGDLFLTLKPGYSLGETLHRQALLPAHLSGHHQQHPGQRTNHAIFDVAGPGVRAGYRFGVVSHRDVHETLRALLGLAPGEGGGEAATRIFAAAEDAPGDPAESADDGGAREPDADPGEAPPAPPP